MPSAVPAEAAARLPKARMIDPRGHRFGAGVSAILLIVAFLTGTPWLVALVFLSIGVERRVRAQVLDLRRDLASHRQGREARPDRAGARVPAALRAGPRVGGPDPVAASRSRSARRRSAGSSRWRSPRLQTLLAVTGYCLGCRLYFLRWWVPDLVTRIWTRGASSAGRLAVEPISYK